MRDMLEEFVIAAVRVMVVVAIIYVWFEIATQP